MTDIGLDPAFEKCVHKWRTYYEDYEDHTRAGEYYYAGLQCIHCQCRLSDDEVIEIMDKLSDTTKKPLIFQDYVNRPGDSEG